MPEARGMRRPLESLGFVRTSESQVGPEPRPEGVYLPGWYPPAIDYPDWAESEGGRYVPIRFHDHLS